MIAFIELLIGVAVVLLAGYLIAEHRDRIRGVATATVLGISAGKVLPDNPDAAPDPRGEDGTSHPAGPHWDGSDSSSDSTDSM